MNHERGKGRPKKENPKCKRIAIRVSVDDWNKIKGLSKKLNMTVTNLIWKGLFEELREDD